VAKLPSPVFKYDLPGFIIEFNKSKKAASGKTLEILSGKTSGKTTEKILLLINQNQYITIIELARIFKMSERSIERNLSLLQKDQRLKRIGGAKGGKWQVISHELSKKGFSRSLIRSQ